MTSIIRTICASEKSGIGSAADAEDLVQQVFLVAHQKLDQIRDAQSVRAWLFTVLRNCYLKRRRKEIGLPLADLDVGSLPEEPPVESFDSEALQAAINALDDEFKIVVLMFYFEQYSYREIAEQLEIPLGTVMSRLSRAKAHLRRRLGEAHPAERGGHVELPSSDATFQSTFPRR